MNKKKVIWVRIDVPQEISSNNENILDSLRLQIVKILLRYYNNHPDFLSITSDIKKIIKEKAALADDDYIKNKIRNDIGQFLFTQTKRRPMVLPVVIKV